MSVLLPECELEIAAAGLDLVLGLQVVHSAGRDAVDREDHVSDRDVCSPCFPPVRQLQRHNAQVTAPHMRFHSYSITQREHQRSSPNTETKEEEVCSPITETKEEEVCSPITETKEEEVCSPITETKEGEALYFLEDA